ncbi:hypothetical protein P171DRAFT_431494 [Karstenula rhodostoma CBS 690.94]|uniref:C2H2-type domain-containing protein n=1 Tax=Karstenula rhodostoma CBS 690.94 TaxID=1392251 RepID=A0A9P4PKP5_9PLEO|nr:hypothetical protein P171DRAFT_431494 [Karstenula rhodostoma CBS 690.94]
MPPRNAPLPNAVNLFNCAICDKGYPRQTDYENHLRSYDHNHRQRLAEMKKLTDANASDAPRAKGPLDMRSLPQSGDAAKMGLGPRFKKVGGAAATATGGRRFRKIGAEGKTEVKKEEVPKVAEGETKKEAVPVADVEAKAQVEASKDEDVVMAEYDDEDDADADAVTWEEYDVMKPSDCDHASCLGCAAPADPVYENGWLVMGSA